MTSWIGRMLSGSPGGIHDDRWVPIFHGLTISLLDWTSPYHVSPLHQRHLKFPIGIGRVRHHRTCQLHTRDSTRYTANSSYNFATTVPKSPSCRPRMSNSASG